MSNELIGMNPDEINALANTMRTSAQRLRSIQSSVGGKVHASPWRGSTADRFRSEWSRTYARTLAAAANDLNTAADTLLRHAREQNNASAENGSNYRASTSAPVRADSSELWRAAEEGLDRAWLGVLGLTGLTGLIHFRREAFTSIWSKIKQDPLFGGHRNEHKPAPRSVAHKPVDAWGRFTRSWSEMAKGPAGKLASGANRFFGIAEVVTKGGQAADALAQGHYAEAYAHSVKTLAAGAKTTKVMYPAGVVLDLFSQICDEAKSGDFNVSWGQRARNILL